MAKSIIECVPNFSEGRDPAKVEKIEEAIRSVAGIKLLGRTLDLDHNRSVITFAGAPGPVLEAAFRGVKRAVALIDLNQHSGAHPRIGAADVVPFVPLEGITLQECAEIAVQAGERLWQQLGVPVYLYEAAARRPDRVKLENIRRGQFEGLRQEIHTDPERLPDFGGPALHATAGAAVVGARKILIAFNINLATADVSIARQIAKSIRFSSGGLPFVKALGLLLRSRNIAQVSMNLTDFEQTPLHVVFERVRAEAERLGIPVASSEIVGLIPKRALEMSSGYDLRIENFHPGLVLENRLAGVSSSGTLKYEGACLDRTENPET